MVPHLHLVDDAGEHAAGALNLYAGLDDVLHGGERSSRPWASRRALRSIPTCPAWPMSTCSRARALYAGLDDVLHGGDTDALAGLGDVEAEVLDPGLYVVVLIHKGLDSIRVDIHELPDRVLRDFQLIDYTLLSGAIGFDAEAGLRRVQEAEGR